MVEEERELNIDDKKEIAEFIISIQEDLENIALHLLEFKTRIEALENQSKKWIKQDSEISQNAKNVNFEYIHQLVNDDTKDRENQLKEHILQSLSTHNKPQKNNNQNLINILLFTCIAIILFLVIRK